MLTVLLSVLALLLGVGAGYVLRKLQAESKVKSAEVMAAQIIADAERDAESKKREALLEAKEEIHKMRAEIEREGRDRRAELQGLERRLIQKDESLERKAGNLDAKDAELGKRSADVERQRGEIEQLIARQRTELERIAGLTTDQAKEVLLRRVEDEVKHEMAIMIKETESQAKEEAEKRSRKIVANAIERCAADQVSEVAVSVVTLPNDEMKGRIIGREGRNIRTLETLTGIDLIIDDTPEAVILSGFDPIRREVARIALERLVADGRIHPARIEEMVEKAQRDVETIVREEGEQATFEAKVHGLHPELIKLLGRLKFRYSYGQNVLRHSVEVAHLAGMMAAELGADEKICRRAGLLHDVGKAVTHEVEGTHLQIGMDLLKKHRETPEVIHAMACHHGDYEPETVEAVLVTAADAVSAARPGARRETIESYIKRLEKLEAIADSFNGVEKSYAIQAGREIRIIVKPDKVDDATATRMAREIGKKIESDLVYPGQIKVTVIRETRSVEYAR